MNILSNRTLRSILHEKVRLHHDKTFLLFEDRDSVQFSMSYEQFEEKVNRLSQALLAKGIKKGQYITLHLPNNLEFLISWFALANIGAIMVPTNILSPSDEMKYVLNHSESVLLITEEQYIEKFTSIIEELPYLKEILLSRTVLEENKDKDLNSLILSVENKVPDISIEPHDVVALLYTSGTTSKPKGVQVTHANYIYAGELMSKSIRLSPEDRQFIVLPFFHGNAQYYSIMSALTVGASIAFTEKFSASRYFNQARAFGATVGSLFAAPIRMILAQKYNPENQQNDMRVIWYAQYVDGQQLEKFESLYNVPLLQMYGMTETIGVPLMNPLDGIRNNASIGKPTLGYEVRLIDGNGDEVAIGEPGQIIVKGVPGETIMKGYFKNPEVTAETIQNGWLHTGDNARIGEDGYFYFVDRIKDMIKRAGENVSASEVEAVIAEHPSVYEVAVVSIPDEIRDEAIKAFVILKQNESITAVELLDYCRLKLAKFKVPDVIEFVEEFPRTSVGKIQKHVLKQQSEGIKQ